MKTIHLIASAHLDPVWMWPWQNGVDAALNTCRTMVTFLERHPEVIFTCGEAWKYLQIQRIDPELFEQIRALINAGRWEVIGGWWIQPDCNAPSGFALERQISLGQKYFREQFGQSPRVAYNVDSFGHAATLPQLMRDAGQDCYVMMRPQEHELQLPARLFRWRGYENGPEVVTFRIAGEYGDFNRVNHEHFRRALTELPEGVDHTMCFLGVGDHGGGPNERLMTWLAQNRDALSDVHLVWSSPSCFFASIFGQLTELPIVTGELQHHAVGCYSVYRPIKVAVRKTEHLLAQAETLAQPCDRAGLDEAWRTLCFNHFHDTLGGTAILSAYAQVEAQLGGARAVADDVMHINLRRRAAAMPADPMQRIVVHNASDSRFTGLVAWEYWWMDCGPWDDRWRLIDEAGVVVPYQRTATEAASTDKQTRLLFDVPLDAGQTRVFRIDRSGKLPDTQIASPVHATPDRITSPTGARVELSRDSSNAVMMLAGHSQPLALPQLHLMDDPTDTWSHGIDRFASGPALLPHWDAPLQLDAGPLMAALLQRGQLEQSRVQAEWRVYHHEPFVELLLRVEWMQRHQVLKLVWPMASKLHRHEDGIPGGSIMRDIDGSERPMRDFTRLQLQDGSALGVVAPEVYALDASQQQVRLTLLRNALVANHIPTVLDETPRAPYTDTGVHEFRFRFCAGPAAHVKYLHEQATLMQRPLVTVDLTRGMWPH